MAALSLLVLLLLLLLLLPLCSSSSSLSFPVFHRDSLSSSSLLPSSFPPASPLRHFVSSGLSLCKRLQKHRPPPLLGRFSYLGEDTGDFYLSALVGSPPQKLILTLDTGSEFTWTGCSPCRVCQLTGPLFRPAHSSSFQRPPCTSSLCLQSLGFSGGQCANDSARSCVFRVGYGDKSQDTGYLSTDVFHFQGSKQLAKPFVFGCAVVEGETVPLRTSGLMGLNAGPFSFPSQLLGSGGGYPNKFAYCLPDRFTHVDASGVILFGDYKLPTKLAYTPLVPPFSIVGHLFYYVDLQGISLGKQLLDIPASALRSNASASGGTILDSGTAITLLVDSAYTALVRAMFEATARLHPFAYKDANADVCYRIPATAKELPEVPSITFHFAGGVDLELGPHSILYAASVERRDVVLCAAFGRALESLPLNIIANYQMQNYWIEYDVSASRVGFSKADCADVQG